MSLKAIFAILAFILFFSIPHCVNKGKSKNGIRINFWYGDNQQFGNLGLAQPCINILGNISSPEKLKTAKYALNKGQFKYLQIGSNSRRLECPGDFNIELETDCLFQGENKIEVIAVDSGGRTESGWLNFTYSLREWPFPYSVSWDTVSNIQHVLQVVDGEWRIDSSGATIKKPGYDRLLTLGDYRNWESYEITAEITPHGLNGWISIGVRWNGHYRETDEAHPYNGWNNAGCSGWIILHEKVLWFEYATGVSRPDRMIIDIENEEPFYWKMKVQTTDENKQLYSQRVWKTTDKEPDWWIEVLESPIDKYKTGSIYLLAHQSSVTFGNLTVKF